ncbi:putative anti-sigma factor [Escherichia phage P896]|nr:putative anti-sigma factor [Escherichia phage P896]
MNMSKEEFELKVYKRREHTKTSAKRRNKDFNLSSKYIANLLKQEFCAYSGERFDENSTQDKVSFERFNNDIGYIEGNVIPVKTKYNGLRADLSLDELKRAQTRLAVRINGGSKMPNSFKVTPADYYKIRKIVKNIKDTERGIKKRQKHLKELYKSGAKDTTPSVIAVKARIHGQMASIGTSQRGLKMVMGGPDWRLKMKSSDAETRYDMYDKIIQGLERLDKLSFIDRLKLKKGLPLNASIFKLIRG